MLRPAIPYIKFQKYGIASALVSITSIFLRSLLLICLSWAFGQLFQFHVDLSIKRNMPEISIQKALRFIPVFFSFRER